MKKISSLQQVMTVQSGFGDIEKLMKILNLFLHFNIFFYFLLKGFWGFGDKLQGDEKTQYLTAKEELEIIDGFVKDPETTYREKLTCLKDGFFIMTKQLCVFKGGISEVFLDARERYIQQLDLHEKSVIIVEIYLDRKLGKSI